jgi:hypothetical protein
MDRRGKCHAIQGSRTPRLGLLVTIVVMSMALVVIMLMVIMLMVRHRGRLLFCRDHRLPSSFWSMKDLARSPLQTEKGFDYYSSEAGLHGAGESEQSSLARAMKTAVGRTDPAGGFQALAQGLAGTMQPDGEVVQRNLQLLGDSLRNFALEIDAPDQFGIVRAERGQQAGQAGAHGRLQVIDGRLLILADLHEFTKIGVITPRFRVVSPIVVNHRMAQNSIEPGDDALVILE